VVVGGSSVTSLGLGVGGGGGGRPPPVRLCYKSRQSGLNTAQYIAGLC
jgi:hypothetical protein